MKKLVLVSLIAVSALAAGRWLSCTSEDAPDARLAFDRVWIDHLPRGETDPVQVFIALDEEPVGVFQNGSQWKGAFEAFRYQRRGGDGLVLLFPQSREREQVSVRATKCGRGEFDYCLEIRGGSRGVKSYVSRKGWEIGSLGAAAAKVDELTGHAR